MPAGWLWEPSSPWPSRGQPQQKLRKSVLVLEFSSPGKGKGLKCNSHSHQSACTSLTLLPAPSLCTGVGWEQGTWGNSLLSTHLGQLVSSGALCHFQGVPFKGLWGLGGLKGSRPAGKKSLEEQLDSADMEIWKDSSWAYSKLNLVNASIFAHLTCMASNLFQACLEESSQIKENQNSLLA